MFGLLARVQHGSFLLERILSGISAEAVANILKTEAGDNILHVYLGTTRQEGLGVLQIMKKAPNFIHEKNIEGFSPYDMLTSFDACISNIITKDVGYHEFHEINKKNLVPFKFKISSAQITSSFWQPSSVLPPSIHAQPHWLSFHPCW